MLEHLFRSSFRAKVRQRDRGAPACVRTLERCKVGLVARKDSYADWAVYMRQVGMDLGETASA